MTFNLSHLSHLIVVAFVFLVATVAKAQVHTGTLFWFIPELGACGFTNTSRQLVASVSISFFNAFPGATPNPNDNPICTRKLLVTSGAKNITASIVDLFVEGGPFDVGLSPAGFITFAPLDDGIVPNVSWSVI